MKKLITLILTATFVFSTATATVYAMPRDVREIQEREGYGDNENDEYYNDDETAEDDAEDDY